MELGQVATSYIPTNGTRVTRDADVILDDLAMSTLRLYGVRDFPGPLGMRSLLGFDGPVGEKGDKGDPSDPGLPGAKGDPGVTCAAGSKGDKGDPGVASAAVRREINVIPVGGC